MRSIFLSTFSAWSVRVLAIFLNIAGLPMALDKLGSSRFGLFLVVLSIGSWIGFANIGMGRVVANIVARYSHHAGSSVQRLVSVALVIAAGFNFLLFLAGSGVFLMIMSHMTWGNIVTDNNAEFSVSILTLFFALCLWFFLSIFEGIDAGHHQLHRLYLFQLLTYGVSIWLLFFVFPRHASIPLAAYILNLSFLGGSILHAGDVIRRNPWLFVWKFEWRRHVVKMLLLSSLDFTIISLGIGVLFQISTGLIGFLAGPTAVVELGIFMRLMQSYGALIIAFTFPLTSIVASEIAGRHHRSARQIITKSGILLMAGAVFAATLFYVLGNDVMVIWMKSQIRFDADFVVAGTFLIVVCAFHFFLAAILIGGSDTKYVARLHLAESIAFVPLTYVFFRANGQAGIIAGLDIILLLGCTWMIHCMRYHVVFKELVSGTTIPLHYSRG